MGRAATSIDAVIGGRLRAVRIERGISQVEMADHVGITFQQVQKYETGANRISASTLILMAQALDVKLTDLLPTPEAASKSVSLEMLESREVRNLIDAFVRIRAPELRRAVQTMCEALARDEVT